VWNNLEEELRKILTFVGLPVDNFDFDAAANLPVRGSSVFHGEEKNVHWKPVVKTPAFDPIQRFSHWNRSVKERFNWIAGQPQERFGYEIERYERHEYWAIWNRAMDSKWLLMGTGKSLAKFVKRALTRTFGAVRMSKAARILVFRRAL
jgi:hypothetical protein